MQLGVKNARPRVLAAGSGVEGRGRLEASAKADAPAQRRQELSRHAGLAMRRRRNVSVQKTAWLAHRQNSAQPARHRGARAGHGAMLAVGTPSLAGPAGLQSAPPQPVAVLRGGVARVAAHAERGVTGQGLGEVAADRFSACTFLSPTGVPRPKGCPCTQPPADMRPVRLRHAGANRHICSSRSRLTLFPAILPPPLRA